VLPCRGIVLSDCAADRVLIKWTKDNSMKEPSTAMTTGLRNGNEESVFLDARRVLRMPDRPVPDANQVGSALLRAGQEARRIGAIVSEPWLNTETIATYCGGVDVSTVQRWCKENEFPHVRADRRGRILSKAAWIDAWLMRNAKFVEQAA
jgi:hypothetical protein